MSARGCPLCTHLLSQGHTTYGITDIQRPQQSLPWCCCVAMRKVEGHTWFGATHRRRIATQWHSHADSELRELVRLLITRPLHVASILKLKHQTPPHSVQQTDTSPPPTARPWPYKETLRGILLCNERGPIARTSSSLVTCSVPLQAYPGQQVTFINRALFFPHARHLLPSRYVHIYHLCSKSQTWCCHDKDRRSARHRRDGTAHALRASCCKSAHRCCCCCRRRLLLPPTRRSLPGLLHHRRVILL